MRKVDDGEKKKKKKKKEKKEKKMAFLVATTSLPAVYRPNSYARTTTAGTLHARANFNNPVMERLYLPYLAVTVFWLYSAGTSALNFASDVQ